MYCVSTDASLNGMTNFLSNFREAPQILYPFDNFLSMKKFLSCDEKKSVHIFSTFKMLPYLFILITLHIHNKQQSAYNRRQ